VKLTELQKSITRAINEKKVKDITSFFEHFGDFEKRDTLGILDNVDVYYLSLDIEKNHAICQQFIILLNNLEKEGLIELSPDESKFSLLIFESDDGQKPAQIDTKLIKILHEHLETFHEGYTVSKEIIPLPELEEFVGRDFVTEEQPTDQIVTKVDSKGDFDLDKIPFSILIRRLNTKQLYFVLLVLIGLLGGSFGLGYKIRSFEFNLQYTEKNSEFPYYSNWQGTWQTETPTFKNVRISFVQSNDIVTGKYQYFSKGVQVDGQIEGKASGNIIDGRWIEYQGNSKLEGQIYLIMASDTRSFTGRYTGNWEGSQGEYVWKGTKVN